MAADPSLGSAPADAGVDVQLLVRRRLNFAMEQSGVPLVRLVTVHNNRATDLASAIFTIQLTPGLGDPLQLRLPTLPPGKVGGTDLVDYRLPPGRLRAVTEAERASLIWSLRDHTGVLAQGVADVEVGPFNQWPGYEAPPELLAAFVTPNHPVIARVLQRVRDRMAATTGDASLEGYQARNSDRVHAMLAALYDTIQSLGITYAELPASYGHGQKIRLPDALLSDQVGCCLDVSVLMAACLEQMGLAPLLVLIQGHAFVAVWMSDDRFPEGVVSDAARLRNLVQLGQIVAIDSSTVVMTPRRSLAQAIAAGTSFLADDECFQHAIDVREVRKAGFRPLPLRTVVAESESPTSVSASIGTGAPPPARVLTRQILVEAIAEPTPAAAEPRPAPIPVSARFRRWQERLLDLTLRNRLLNFRPDARGSLQLLVPNLAGFEDRLAADAEFELMPLRQVSAGDERDPRLVAARSDAAEVMQQLASDMKAGRLRVVCGTDELLGRCTKLDRTAQLDLNEGGANTLFVTIGMLRWFEDASPTAEARLAPLILYPARLGLDRAKARIKLSRLPDDPVPNVTLVEKLKREHAVDLSALLSIESDESGLDVAAAMQAVRAAIQARSRWEVLEEVHIGLFTFNKFLMWKDLEDNAQIFLQNDVVKHIAEKDYIFTPVGKEFSPAELDGALSAAELPCVVDADSTQMAAVASALSGRSFVLQGPPGTGKSQTITNLIAAAIACGKTVLFVSEKMAALEVVHRRLEGVGLGDFCLELHSHKSNKKDVLASLGCAFEHAERVGTVPWQERSNEVTDLRMRLNGYATAIHRGRPIGRTYYQAASDARAHAQEQDVRLSIPGIESWTAERLRAARAAIGDFAAAAAAVEPAAGHAFAMVAPPPWTAKLDEDMRDALAEAISAVDDADVAAAPLVAALRVTSPLSTTALDSIVRVLALATTGPVPRAAMAPGWLATSARARDYLKAWRADDGRRAQLAPRWNDKVFGLDLDWLSARYGRWATAFFFIAWLMLRKAKQLVAPAARATLPERGQIAEDLKIAAQTRDATSSLAAQRTDIARELGGWDATNGTISDLEQVLTRGDVMHRELESLDTVIATTIRESDLGTAGSAMAAVVDRLAKALERLKVAEARVATTLGLNPGQAWPASADPQHRAGLRSMAHLLHSNAPSFRTWCHYCSASKAMDELGLAPLCRAHRAGSLPAARVVGAFERSFWTRFAASLRDGEPALGGFDGEAHHRVVERFAAADAEHIALSRSRVLAQLEQRLPARGATSAESSEPGILGRELKKKARHLPVRRLLGQIPNLLPRLKPCLLMSPLSIAQYLPASSKRFDLVVFDEASQIGTHDAIGAIARGNQVIVVGDSKQLPPTSFFQRAAANEDSPLDENDQEELESVLDEAVAKGLPQQMLGWHYRSRHDSLIDFSNQHYYGGKLHVFPAAARFVDDLGVTWHGVPDGVYQGGSATEYPRTNPREAAAVVSHLVESLRRHAPGTRTFGVVTFSMAQQTLIADLLDAARAKHPEIEGHFQIDEVVFVKNLENVQGDERDEILFSIGYAKDEHGKLRMHFGPLSIAGGQRRLNVAVTRARCQLRVFSTLTPDQIDLSRTNSDGSRHLKQFLEFAMRRGAAETRVVAARAENFDSTWVREIRDAVQALGQEVHVGIGAGAYRVDLGVVHPQQPGTYALGIECDGSNYASAATARDRDRLRAQVLSSLGWQTIRVWAADWAHDRDRQVARIRHALAAVLAPSAMGQMQRQPPAPARAPMPAPASVATTVETPLRSARPPRTATPPAVPVLVREDAPIPQYVEAQLEAVSDDPSSVYQPFATRFLVERAATVVRTEAPVHIDLLGRRVVACFGLTKLTAKARGRVVEGLRELSSRSVIMVQGEFVWTHGHGPELYRSFRGPTTTGETRDIEQIAPEEIANAIAYVLSRAMSLPREVLTRETSRLFGISRLGKNVLSGIEVGLERLESSGRCSVEGERIVWRGKD